MSLVEKPWARTVGFAIVAGASAVAVMLLLQRRRRRPRVCDLLIYPVKSCAEVRKATAIAGDGPTVTPRNDSPKGSQKE